VANSRTGSGVQQTRSRRAEKAVEVVRNHVGGTRVETGGAVGPKGASAPGSGRVIGMSVEGRKAGEPQERVGSMSMVVGTRSGEQRCEDSGCCCGRFEGEAKVTGVDSPVVRHQAGDASR
jgi:hypothetical protein